MARSSLQHYQPWIASCTFPMQMHLFISEILALSSHPCKSDAGIAPEKTDLQSLSDVTQLYSFPSVSRPPADVMDANDGLIKRLYVYLSILSGTLLILFSVLMVIGQCKTIVPESGKNSWAPLVSGQSMSCTTCKIHRRFFTHALLTNVSKNFDGMSSTIILSPHTVGSPVIQI